MKEEILHRKYRNRGYIDTYARRWSSKAEEGIWGKTLANKNSYVNKDKSYDNFAKVIGDVFSLHSPEQVLDFGCGTCDLWESLLTKENEKNFHGLDVANGMIDVAKKRYPNSNFFVGDILDVKKIISDDKNFDFIFSRGVVMNHMGKEYFSQILNNLHSYSGGVLMFDYVNSEYFESRPKARRPSFPLYSKGEVLEMISNTPFKNLEVKLYHEDRRDPIIILK